MLADSFGRDSIRGNSPVADGYSRPCSGGGVVDCGGVSVVTPVAAGLPPTLKLRRTRHSLVRLRAKRYGETSTKLEERSRGEGGQPCV
jgi:hypothetical protein